MSSAGYKPLNDTDTEEELKNIQGKVKEVEALHKSFKTVRTAGRVKCSFSAYNNFD